MDVCQNLCGPHAAPHVVTDQPKLWIKTSLHRCWTDPYALHLLSLIMNRILLVALFLVAVATGMPLNSRNSTDEIADRFASMFENQLFVLMQLLQTLNPFAFNQVSRIGKAWWLILDWNRKFTTLSLVKHHGWPVNFATVEWCWSESIPIRTHFEQCSTICVSHSDTMRDECAKESVLSSPIVWCTQWHTLI